MDKSAPKEATMMVVMTTQERQSPGWAAASMMVTLPKMPENGGKPTMENAPATKTADVSGSRRAMPESLEMVPVP